MGFGNQQGGGLRVAEPDGPPIHPSNQTEPESNGLIEIAGYGQLNSIERKRN